MFSTFDKKITETYNIIGYSRYVDDVLVLVKGRISKENITSFIPNIEDNNNKMFINIRESLILKKLPLNQKKIEINSAKNKMTIKKMVTKITLPYLIEEIPEGEIHFRDNYSSLKNITKKINNYIDTDNVLNNDSNSKYLDFKNYIFNLKDNEIINALSTWRFIFIILNENDKLEFRIKIEQIIKKIEVDDKLFLKKEQKQIKKTLVITLKKELDTIFNLINSNNKFNLFNLSQENIYEYIDDYITHKDIIYEFFPINVSIEDVFFYLSTKTNNIESYIEDSLALYKKINGFDFDKDSDIRKIAISKKQIYKDDCLSKLYTIDKKINELIYETLPNNKIGDFDNKKKTIVATSSILMQEKEIIHCDIINKYPKTYNTCEIIKLIKEAKSNKAKYIVFPEFCIPHNKIIKIVKFCKQNCISLISGLTHFIVNNEATNFTAIYDAFTGLFILKKKNYYPYEEEALLSMNRYRIKISTPYYLIFNNDYIKYSTMTCFEATNIFDRALFKDEINLLYMPVYNKDTNYFSSIISSTARDLSIFIAQSNNSQYGNSRITAPCSNLYKEIVQVKGGINNYVVVGELDFEDMDYKHLGMKVLIENIKNVPIDKSYYYEELEKIKNNKFKPLSAGSDYYKRKKNGL